MTSIRLCEKELYRVDPARLAAIAENDALVDKDHSVYTATHVNPPTTVPDR